MTAPLPGIRVESVSRRFGERAAVNAVDLTLNEGRITCLLGPSGCGKSTLLRMIAGLEIPDVGRILAGDRVLSGPGGFVPPERRGIGLVFQDYGLFPHLTVEQNVAFGLTRLPRAERQDRARALLEQVKLDGHARAWPHTLSGGEQQRVALARALAPRPAAILLDEPFSGLDPHLKADLREALIAALREAGAAVLVVTHDAEDALRMADDLVLMDQGEIIQRGAPTDCYLRPTSIAAARMLGDVNVWPATVRDGWAQTPLGRVPTPGLPNGEANLLARPEAIRLDDRGVEASVIETRFIGACVELVLAVEGHRLRAQAPATQLPAGGVAKVALNMSGAVTLLPPEK